MVSVVQLPCGGGASTTQNLSEPQTWAVCLLLLNHPAPSFSHYSSSSSSSLLLIPSKMGQTAAGGGKRERWGRGGWRGTGYGNGWFLILNSACSSRLKHEIPLNIFRDGWEQHSYVATWKLADEIVCVPIIPFVSGAAVLCSGPRVARKQTSFCVSAFLFLFFFPAIIWQPSC